MNSRIARALYTNAAAVMTGAAFREITMPFTWPFEFSRDFPEGIPADYPEHLGKLTRPLFEAGLDVEVFSLKSEGTPRVTVVCKFS